MTTTNNPSITVTVERIDCDLDRLMIDGPSDPHECSRIDCEAQNGNEWAWCSLRITARCGDSELTHNYECMSFESEADMLASKLVHEYVYETIGMLGATERHMGKEAA